MAEIQRVREVEDPPVKFQAILARSCELVLSCIVTPGRAGQA